MLNALEQGKGAEQGIFSAVRRLSEITGTPVPKPIADIENKPLRFSKACEKGQIGSAVLEAAGWKA